jgi:hypothetical protein
MTDNFSNKPERDEYYVAKANVDSLLKLMKAEKIHLNKRSNYPEPTTKQNAPTKAYEEVPPIFTGAKQAEAPEGQIPRGHEK